jgi:hypothetical protein
VLSSLPKLGTGEAWVWAPRLDIFRRAQIRPRHTFDSSAQQKIGTKHVAPKSFAEVDLEKLRGKLAAAVEKAKADDPRELRKQIVELQRKLDTRLADAMIRSVAEPKTVEKFVLKDGQLARAEKLIDRAERLAQTFGKLVELPLKKIYEDVAGVEEDFRVTAKEIRDAIASTRQPAPPATVRPTLSMAPHPAEPAGSPGRSSMARVAERLRAPALPAAAASSNGHISGPQQRILNALAWAESVNLPLQRREKVAFLADASPTSSSFTNNLGALRSAGLIDYPQQGTVALTAAGREVAQADGDNPTTSEELQNVICGKLPAPQARIVRELVRVYPRALVRGALADLTGASEASSSFTNNLGALRSLGLIDYPQRGMVAAQPTLFLEGE